jgi:hypothetical protein
MMSKTWRKFLKRCTRLLQYPYRHRPPQSSFDTLITIDAEKVMQDLREEILRSRRKREGDDGVD